MHESAVRAADLVGEEGAAAEAFGVCDEGEGGGPVGLALCCDVFD